MDADLEKLVEPEEEAEEETKMRKSIEENTARTIRRLRMLDRRAGVLAQSLVGSQSRRVWVPQRQEAGL